ncbi:cobalt-precorrin-5B (C(1))-methyltransferase [uncultured Salinisphaera sp.]|uniref:cobalt-precorrin-5B (C(1))-methyltransferase n=1 Tax=uncultured Salinisphaera sp. TaxID=359372 RepID=UPI0032B1C8E1|tara:strand:- start:2418 stop:3545 length:1128 start_codon:yes stop_codon:yes gene_type:complete
MKQPTSPAPAGAKLRTGWTTGATATAAAVASAYRLLAGQRLSEVELSLPKNRRATLVVHDQRVSDDGQSVVTGLIKDAGDDPDATHGARVWVALERADAPGVTFCAGQGVGTVTRTGLALPVGEPAINPVPRDMIAAHLAHAAEVLGYTGGFIVTVGVDDGERIAESTMNARLGILGGLSILGTTGIVRPFSCAAYIASIHQAMDVARANDMRHLAACTGSTSERVAQAEFALDDMALVEMGDFAGAVLKYLRRQPVRRLSLVGGFGKFSKLATGRLDLHSRRGGVDFDYLAELASDIDADARRAMRTANTSLAALAIAEYAGIDLADRVARAVWHVAARYRPASETLDVVIIDKPGQVLATVTGKAQSSSAAQR